MPFQFDRFASYCDCDCEAREVEEVRTGHLIMELSINNDDDDVVFAERTIDQQGERRVPGSRFQQQKQKHNVRFFTMESVSLLWCDW